MGLLTLIVVIVFCYFIAKEFGQIAAEKGFTQSKYFWWTFWVLPVGVLMVIALPDRGSRAAVTGAETSAVSTASVKLPELPDL